jgi:hypothetical protein
MIAGMNVFEDAGAVTRFLKWSTAVRIAGVYWMSNMIWMRSRRFVEMIGKLPLKLVSGRINGLLAVEFGERKNGSARR